MKRPFIAKVILSLSMSAILGLIGDKVHEVLQLEYDFKDYIIGISLGIFCSIVSGVFDKD